MERMMKLDRIVAGWVSAAVVLVCASCASARGSSGGDCVVEGLDETPAHWAAVCAEFDAIRQPRKVSFQVGDERGVILTYTRGGVTPQTYHPIASASKWVASAVFMRLVERGELSLDDHPQAHLDWWTSDASDARSEVTLEQLLAFKSGFGGGPGEVKCAGRARSTTLECGQQMYEQFFTYEPGVSFHYGPAHMHVAALMAQEATGKTWAELLEREVVTPLGLSAQTRYTMASEQNPRIAGGISMTGEDYAKFLRAQLAGEYLAGSFDKMSRDHTPSPVKIAHSPLTRAGFEWHYGLGMWRECSEPTFTSGCAARTIVSSPGAYGFYPWIDRDRKYWAVMSTRRSILANASEASVLAGQRLQPLIIAALEKDRAAQE